MTWICLSAYLVFLSYVMLIVFFTAGWMKMKLFISEPVVFSKLITVVVAVRNESQTISVLLEALSNQTCQNFEMIIVDDHSTDNTVQIISGYGFKKLMLFSLPDDKTGKKESLRYGIEKSKGELIVTTDADCIPGKQWLETMVAFYKKEKAEFIIAPVKHSYNDSLLQKLISVDFISLQAAGAGAAEIQIPFICNGANLAFTRSLWDTVFSDSKNEYVSGDDTFLLHSAVKKYSPEKIRFLFSENAVVKTPAPGSIRDFFQQRIRWASKAKGYKNNMSVWTSLIVSFLVFSITILFLGSFFSKTLFYCFAGIIIMKTVIEIPLMYYTVKFYKEEGMLRFFIILQPIYFLYTFLIIIFSIFGKFTWKERIIKN